MKILFGIIIISIINFSILFLIRYTKKYSNISNCIISCMISYIICLLLLMFGGNLENSVMVLIYVAIIELLYFFPNICILKLLEKNKRISKDKIEILRELKKLLDDDIITEDEFNNEKNKILK